MSRKSYASILAPITLPDPDGVEHCFGDYWAEGPAVTVFLRHYG